ncbi:MAG: hypothetical protein IJG84_14510 [Kiritimatiellae bacterium]|nr:hypothetical protein [Kiritimatiellia bacterium]
MNHNRSRDKVISLMFGFVVHSLAAATAGFDVVVVDADTGKPMSGVVVAGWFGNSNGWKAWTEDPPTYEDKATTDENGRCHVKGETNTGETGVAIAETPVGYYAYAGTSHWFTEKPILPLMHWRPTDLVITAALYRIERPMPLFVKKAFGKFNVDWRKVGDAGTNIVLRYDFLAGDWLPPVGKGIVADMTVRAKMATSWHVRKWQVIDGSERIRKRQFYEIMTEFEFDGEGNGVVRKIAPSNAGVFIRTAGVDGYAKSFRKSAGRRKKIVGPNVYGENYSDVNADACHVFRIRSKFDEQGNLKEAYYGKVYGDFQLRGTWKDGCDGVSFLYYLNPTPNDRNLEWDTKNNLCQKPGDVRTMINHCPMRLP